ncbi:Inositol 2-dehydrogenase [Anatilimnocola aggregata]|uniref:Inositol 2-dehydrogenase n=1 Tax=Anatilimnocola aggregata TaxID=2528021 RepID=A0A517Y4I5_9BACT|nr:Gfo/Idh/MocA family oxidoreductase [Anatilimnocola aggregata]QDU25154.1 Inositol 2-dehydrogenase [Anatilimnocola aggregata]
MARVTRRRFLSASAAASSALALGAWVNVAPAQESKSPNEKLNLAGVGTTGRAGANLNELAYENLVCMADVDSDKLDQAAVKFSETRKYRDFRDMLEKEGDKIDAVVVGTPDHTHAPAAAMALRMGKHVYCEKPLTHTVVEARTLSTLAKEKKLVTQMGNQIHAGDNYRRVVEAIQGGSIGEVDEVHVWAGAIYTGATFTTNTTAPKNLDWNLWLGPAAERPYSEGVHPFTWRKYWDYGTGSLGDFGCHYMDLPHWALELRGPSSVEASGTPYDPVSCPGYCLAKYEYPARGKFPACKLFWYDSGKQPELLTTLKHSRVKPETWKSGVLFVGSKGMLLSSYGDHFLFPEEKFTAYKAPPQTIAKSLGHHREWTTAIRTGSPTLSNFDYAGALTEAVLLGTVAYRHGSKIEWDSENLKITNAPAAQKWLHKEYRKGWTL